MLPGCRSPRVVPGKGERIMPTYRAYLINGNNGVTSYRPVEADTGAGAMKAASRAIHSE